MFSILYLGNPNFLEEVAKDYKLYSDEKYDGEWFRLFHKTFRQCDIFSDDICFVNRRITEKENIERNEILSKRKKIRDKIGWEAEIVDIEYHNWVTGLENEH